MSNPVSDSDSNPMSDIHPNSNGSAKAHVIPASLAREMTKLEIKVRALTLHPKDVVLIQYASQPNATEIISLQQNLRHMMEHLQLSFPVFWMLVPPGITLTQLDPVEMEKMGWVRKETQQEEQP